MKRSDSGPGAATAASSSSQVTGVATSGTGVARSEYGAIVDFIASFWLQSRKIFPVRSARDMRAITVGSRSASSAASSRAIALVSANDRPLTGACTWMPLLPEVLA